MFFQFQIYLTDIERAYELWIFFNFSFCNSIMNYAYPTLFIFESCLINVFFPWNLSMKLYDIFFKYQFVG